MFKELLQIVADHGLLSAGIVSIILIIIRYVTAMKDVWDRRDRERQEESDEVRREELKNHPFFTNASFKINSEIPVMTLDNERPVRQQLFRDLIKYHFMAIESFAHELVEKDVDKLSPQAWAFLVIDYVTKMNAEFQADAITAGVPAIAIQKYTVWNKSTMDTIVGYVNNLAVSTVYTTNTARMNTFLFLLNLFLTTTMGDVHQAFSEMNGAVSGLQYQNATVE
jgi:hypothetical protein